MKANPYGIRMFLLASLVLLLNVLAGAMSQAWAQGVGTWADAGPMQDRRTNHTATRLANGKVLFTGPYASAEIYDPDAGTFAATGSMNSGRYQATATLLQNGLVLIVGGDLLNAGGGGTPLATAELYDPATGVFTATGTMSGPRSSHVATLLANGKVLITGGYDAGHQALDRAELYNPSTGSFTVIANPMLAGRHSHTATLLDDGSVLIVGGRDSSNNPIPSAERFDGISQFAHSGTPYQPRSEHTATLLPSGLVLIVGGQDENGTYLDIAELYDPATQSFAHLFNRPAARTSHTATVLPNGKVLIAGGYGSGGALGSAEVFDPVASTFAATGSMAHGRAWHTATLLDSGKILVAGGYNFGSPPVLASAELYCPDCGVLNPTGSLATARTNHTATRLKDGTVLIAGGYNSSAGYYLDTAEIYNPATGIYTQLPATMPRPRGYHTATLLPDGRVLFVGGKNRTYSALASADIYDPATATFSFAALTGVARIGHTATLKGDSVVIIGGDDFETASVEIYRNGEFGGAGYLQDKWPRKYHSATLLPDGDILVVGGNQLTQAEIFHAAHAYTTKTFAMSGSRYNHAATLLPDGTVLISGGEAWPTGVQVPSIGLAEIYDPATEAFSAVARMAKPRSGHGATLLSNGKVLMSGGQRRYSSTVGNTMWTEYVDAAELYDPATKAFSSAGFLDAGRTGHTATFLNNCKVLIAGGTDGLYLASSELYKPAVCGDFSCGPEIAAISPTSGQIGTVVTIAGTGFGPMQGASTVSFNGVVAGTVTSWSDTSITVIVPAGASTGPVVVTVDDHPSNGLIFSIASTCASNVSGQVLVARGGYRYNRTTQRYVQQLTLTNAGGAAIAGPVSVALDSLTANVTLFNKTGTTTCATPVSPYAAVNVGSDNVLAVGEKASVSFEFTNPTNVPIGYAARILSGTSK